MRMVRKDRKSQRVVQGEDSVGGARVTTDVVQNNGEPRASRCRMSGVRRMWCRRGSRVGSLIPVEKRLNRGFDLAAACKKKTKSCEGQAESEKGITRERS